MHIVAPRPASVKVRPLPGRFRTAVLDIAEMLTDLNWDSAELADAGLAPEAVAHLEAVRDAMRAALADTEWAVVE